MPAATVKHRTVDNLFIRIFMSHSLTINTGWNSEHVNDSSWRLYINTNDGASIDWRGGRFAIRQSRVHLIPPWMTFTCRCTRPVEHFYIHFDLTGLPGTAVRDVFDRPLRLRGGSTAQQCAEQLAQAVREDSIAAMPALFRAKAVVSEAMAEAFSVLSKPALARCSQLITGQHDVAPAVHYIDSRFAEPITNGELAEMCHLSESHFTRRFRAEVGQSPLQYIIERRVSNGAQMLLFTDMSIEQIAEATGFSNRFHFSAAFARVMGQPPATYRKAGRV